jgi:hypothetical protein
MNNLISQIAHRFCALGPSLKDAFDEIDKDRNGTISYHEFVDAIHKLNLGLKKAQLYDLMRTIDINGDNQISFGEFSSKFQVSYDLHRIRVDPNSPVLLALRQIGQKMLEIFAL